MSIGPEQFLLSKEQVLKAEQRIDAAHPVIVALAAHEPRITEINEKLKGITSNTNQQRYVAENFGFLLDDVQQINGFPLGPLDLVAIWSKAGEIFDSNYEHYALARIVATAYAVQGTSNPAWNSFPRQEIETHSLPAELVEDKEGLLHVKKRLDEIGDSINELEYYSSGVRGKFATTMAVELAKRINSGDTEAKNELDALLAYNKEHSSLILGRIGENFGNALIGVYMRIEAALSK